MDGLEELIGGIGILALCGTLFAIHLAPGWVMFIGVFFGGLPAIKGARRMVRDRERRQVEDRQDREERNAHIQRSILKTARQNRGVVTPSLVSLEANIPIVEADAALQDMAARGYAELNIRENGTLEYRFPDLLP